MKLFMAVMFIALLTGFTGCETFKTERQKIEAACAGAESAKNLVAIAMEEEKLSDTAYQKALTLTAEVDKVCTQDEPTLDGTALGTLKAQIAQLQDIGKGLGQ